MSHGFDFVIFAIFLSGWGVGLRSVQIFWSSSENLKINIITTGFLCVAFITMSKQTVEF